MVLPCDKFDRARIIVRRSNILTDSFHLLRNGLDVTKYLRVTFVNEPAVDEGGPLREYFRLLLSAIESNSSLLSGIEFSRTPTHNVCELEKMSYFYIGVIIALSLVHGGPAPHFFSPAVADYIVYGVQKVHATIADIPSCNMQNSIQKVMSMQLNFLVLTHAFSLVIWLLAKFAQQHRQKYNERVLTVIIMYLCHKTTFHLPIVLFSL